MHISIETLQPIVALIVNASIPLIGLLIHKRLRTPSDQQSAKNPTDSWRNLLASTVREVSNAAGLPTKNAGAIERAAAAALVSAQSAGRSKLATAPSAN